MKRFIDRLFAPINWPVEMIVRHFENRLQELAMATVMVVQGLLLTFSPGSFEAEGIIYLNRIVTPHGGALIFYSLGLARFVALLLNGHWQPYGAWVRAAGAASGAFVWSVIVAAFVIFAVVQDQSLPFSTGTYAVLTWYELVSMYRALAGAKNRNGGRARDVGHSAVGDPDGLKPSSGARDLLARDLGGFSFYDPPVTQSIPVR